MTFPDVFQGARQLPRLLDKCGCKITLQKFPILAIFYFPLFLAPLNPVEMLPDQYRFAPGACI